MIQVNPETLGVDINNTRIVPNAELCVIIPDEIVSQLPKELRGLRGKSIIKFLVTHDNKLQTRSGSVNSLQVEISNYIMGSVELNPNLILNDVKITQLDDHHLWKAKAVFSINEFSREVLFSARIYSDGPASKMYKRVRAEIDWEIHSESG